MPLLKEDYDVFLVSSRFPFTVPNSFACVVLYVYTLGILDIRWSAKREDFL